MPFDTTVQTPQDLTAIAEAPAHPGADAEPALWPIYAGLAVFLLAMAGSVVMFGLPGLYIPAVAFVPVMYFMLVRVSLG